MNTIKIGNKLIGEKQRCFIIAEAGVNHNGSLKLAKKLVDVAVKANVDSIKFQTFTAKEVATDNVGIPEYAKKNICKNMKQVDMLKKVELSYDDIQALKDYCDKKCIIFLSTPHSFDAIDFLEDLVPAYKFGSGDLTNIPALKHAAKKKKPLILGTGMATLQEVRNAIHAISSEGNKKIIVLHCTTNYPCSLEEVNLNAMITMKKKLGCLVGYSDHTLGTLVPVLAVALGATVIEKHFTLNRKLSGPDHKASLEPNELIDMVKSIRDTEKILGGYEKKPTTSEKALMNIVRKSIVASKDIKKGSIIRREMLTIKRPGTGITPGDIEKLIGMRTKCNVKKDEILQKGMVE